MLHNYIFFVLYATYDHLSLAFTIQLSYHVYLPFQEITPYHKSILTLIFLNDFFLNVSRKNTEQCSFLKK